jgi:hypothetical protein
MAFFSKSGVNNRQKQELLSGPVFVKPFSDKSADIKALSDRLEMAPPESKYIFREALSALREKEAMHDAVYQELLSSGLPSLILHDLHIFSKSGSAIADFVILAPQFIATVSCLGKEDEPPISESGATTSPERLRSNFASEQVAYVLSETFRLQKALSGKFLRNVWPITVPAQEIGDNTVTEPVRTFSSECSIMYPEIHRTHRIPADSLGPFFDTLMIGEKATMELSEKKLYVLSDLLLSYEKQIAGGVVSYRPDSKQEG